jgi:hypothetical protein
MLFSTIIRRKKGSFPLTGQITIFFDKPSLMLILHFSLSWIQYNLMKY